MPTETVVTPEAILSECPRLGLDDKFAFRCGTDLDCFGRCCHDVSIVLTPYDVLRLKRAAGVDSTEFLDKHTMTLGAGMVGNMTEERQVLIAEAKSRAQFGRMYQHTNDCLINVDHALGYCTCGKDASDEQRKFWLRLIALLEEGS